ncbi:MAG TPA: Clp protease N-terminal domain-containing protein [Verrucomicrobiae bacterium]|nr:Clp protease N-terminal domain-containing protein [Verrucomicrobiae bacterium]
MQAAQQIARELSHQEIDGERLALALIQQEESLIPDLLERVGVPMAHAPKLISEIFQPVRPRVRYFMRAN